MYESNDSSPDAGADAVLDPRQREKRDVLGLSIHAAARDAGDTVEEQEQQS